MPSSAAPSNAGKTALPAADAASTSMICAPKACSTPSSCAVRSRTAGLVFGRRLSRIEDFGRPCRHHRQGYAGRPADHPDAAATTAGVQAVRANGPSPTRRYAMSASLSLSCWRTASRLGEDAIEVIDGKDRISPGRGRLAHRTARRESALRGRQDHRSLTFKRHPRRC